MWRIIINLAYMKKYLIAILLCCSLTLINAQTITTTSGMDKYIEVKITDTMMVQADQITLIISIEEDEDEYDWDWYDEEVEEATDEAIEEAVEELPEELTADDNKDTDDADELSEKQKEIEVILNKYNVQFKFYGESEAAANPLTREFSIYNNAYKVSIDSVAILEKLQEELKAIEGIESSITEVNLKDKHAYELMMISKLMKKAKTEATAIAGAMNAKLGKPLNVSNQSMEDITSNLFNNKESFGGLGALFSMIGNMFKNANNDNPTLVTVSKTVIVRYAYTYE